MPTAALRRIPFNDVESEFMRSRQYRDTTKKTNVQFSDIAAFLLHLYRFEKTGSFNLKNGFFAEFVP
jgi:hypothetical protein